MSPYRPFEIETVDHDWSIVFSLYHCEAHNATGECPHIDWISLPAREKSTLFWDVLSGRTARFSWAFRFRWVGDASRGLALTGQLRFRLWSTALFCAV